MASSSSCGIGTAPPLQCRLPNAVNVILFAQVNLPVYAGKFFLGISVKEEKPARLKEKRNTPERLLQGVRISHIIDTVKAAQASPVRALEV